MTALIVVVSRVLGDGSDERFLSKEDHLIETLGLDRPHEPFRIRVHVRRLVGGKQNLDARAAYDRLQLGREDRITIDDEETPPRQETLLTVRQISGHLFHPRRRRVRRRAGDVYATRGDVDNEQREVPDQPASCPHLGREEVGGGNKVCVRSDEGRPTEGTIGRGLDSMLL